MKPKAQESYNQKKTLIQQRLEQFKKLSKKQKYKEFLFCLLTPQSNAKKCWQAVQQISKIKNPSKSKIKKILKTKTRFHNTKANYIYNAPKTYKKISSLLKNTNPNIQSIRNQLSKTVKGYGLKESSHFLRNIGFSNNKIAILDRHILKNLYNQNLTSAIKIKSPKHYHKIEQIFLNHAKKLKIPPDHLDLLWWSQETREIFK